MPPSSAPRALTASCSRAAGRTNWPGRSPAINAARAEAGTADRPFRIFATAMGRFLCRHDPAAEELGVTDMPVAFRNLYAVEEDSQPLAEKIDAMKHFADTVIARQ
jgi:hypothetical protein